MARCGGVSVGAPQRPPFRLPNVMGRPEQWVRGGPFACVGCVLPIRLCGLDAMRVLPVIIRAAFAARCALAVGLTPRFPFCCRRGGGGAALRCRCGLARRATMIARHVSLCPLPHRVRDENAPIRNATVVLKIITSWRKGTGREGWERSVFSRCGMLRLRAARTMAGGACRASRQARGNSGGGCAFDGLSSHVVSAGLATNGAQGSAEAPACNPTSLMPARRNRNRVSLPTDILNGTEHMEGAP